MPRNLEKVHNYPQPVKWATLFRANPVILLLQISSLTLNNLHYILSDLWKAARSAQVEEKSKFLYGIKCLCLLCLWIGVYKNTFYPCSMSLKFDRKSQQNSFLNFISLVTGKFITSITSLHSLD